MTDLTPIIQAALAFIAALITVVLIPWIKSKTTAEQQQLLIQWVNVAVMAAEQIYRGGGRGEEKKAYVVEFLESKGLYVDTDKVNALIEAKVAELNGSKTVG